MQTLETRRHGPGSGFVLVEVIIATGMLAVAGIALAALFSVAVGANHRARMLTAASVLAQAKMEELVAAVALSPTAVPTSPPDALTENVEGCYDVVDQAVLRRWSIAPMPDRPAVLVLRVLVAPGAGEVRLLTLREPGAW